MENVLLTFPDASSEPQLSVRHFRIEEAVSSLFTVRIEARSPLHSLDLADLTGRDVLFTLHWTVNRRWQGVCRKSKLLRVADDREGLATYEFEIVPHLFQLTQRRNNRLMQHVSIPQMVTKILDEWRIEHEWRIRAEDYLRLELRTQFDETDHDFICRLLEEAGITYWFVEGKDRQAKLVLSDSPSAHPDRPGPPLAFVDDVTLARASRKDFVTQVQIEEVAMPGRVTLRDEDARNPRRPIYAEASSKRIVEHSHEQYAYTPGAFRVEGGPMDVPATPVADDLGVSRIREGRGRTLARQRVEAFDAQRFRVTFETSVVDLAPATTFRIVGHPHDDLSVDTRLLMLRFVVEGEASTASEWRFIGTATYADRPYRPPLITAKPKMYGVLTAVVVGPEGKPGLPISIPGSVGSLSQTPLAADAIAASLVDNDIYVDELGRVRVQFPWDREHDFNSASSIWMRVSQGWAGGGYGLFTIPRVGHEVLVSFINGDPDDPLIVGRVHNLKEPVPFPLPDNKTVSTFKTATSPGGNGFNELRFDDAAGREHVYMQAQKDMDQLVKNDLKQSVGHDRSRYVQNHENVGIGGDKTKFVNLNELQAIGLNHEQFVGVNRLSTVGVEDSTMVGRRWSVAVARGLTSTLAGELERAAGVVGNVMRNAATSVLGLIPNDPLAKAADAALSSFGRSAFERIHNALDVLEGFGTEPGPPPTTIEMVDRQIKLSTGEASIVLDGPNIIMTAQGTIALHAMKSISVLGEEELALAAREKVALISATDDVLVQAHKDVHLNPYPAGDPLPNVVRLEGDVFGDAPRCDLHPDHDLIEEGDRWRCPLDLHGDDGAQDE